MDTPAPGPGTSITVYPDGPLIVRGDFTLGDVKGKPIEHTSRAVALCRCGKSQSKPFCDGTHKRIQRPRPSSDALQM